MWATMDSDGRAIFAKKPTYDGTLWLVRNASNVITATPCIPRYLWPRGLKLKRGECVRIETVVAKGAKVERGK